MALQLLASRFDCLFFRVSLVVERMSANCNVKDESNGVLADWHHTWYRLAEEVVSLAV